MATSKELHFFYQRCQGFPMSLFVSLCRSIMFITNTPFQERTQFVINLIHTITFQNCIVQYIVSKDYYSKQKLSHLGIFIKSISQEGSFTQFFSLFGFKAVSAKRSLLAITFVLLLCCLWSPQIINDNLPRCNLFSLVSSYFKLLLVAQYFLSKQYVIFPKYISFKRADSLSFSSFPNL